MQGKGIKGAPPANPLFLSALEHEPRYSRRQLRQEASLTALDIDQINQCRRPHNRLGFGYQLCFVRLLNRFPAQQPFELIDELLTFVGVHLAVDAGLITHYQHRRQTISEHQQRITEYLQHTPFGETEAKRLEAFVFEESCCLGKRRRWRHVSKSSSKSRRSCSPPIPRSPGSSGSKGS